MGRRVSIPVRIVGRPEYQAPLRTRRPGTPGSAPHTSEGVQYERAFEVTGAEEQEAAAQMMDEGRTSEVPDTPDVAPKTAEFMIEGAPEGREGLQEEVDGWRDQAMRLQADMDNYRKRQQRLAQDQIEAERQRLLGAFLNVVDDLERALAAPSTPGDGLRGGVELTHRTAMQMLQKEGVESIDAKGQPFDPNWHDAVATVAHNGGSSAAGTVVEVMEPGYRLGDRLLRPAKVIVAV